MRDPGRRCFGLIAIAILACGTRATAQETTARTDAAGRRELVFIDARISERGALLNDLRAQSHANHTLDVIVVDAQRDGLRQISDALAGRKKIAAIHVLSHGSAGRLLLGNRVLDAEALEARAVLLSGWAEALTADADILLYACNAGAGASGDSLITTLARLTGADVAASQDPTGNGLLGGDWDLERRTGAIETPVAPSAQAQRQWAGVLASNGKVVAEQKISDLAGGLAAILDNGDWFGLDTGGIGDLDGDGIEDIAVGVYADDDGGTDRGAVYILFLNANGTVKAEQKISDTVGGLAAILDNTDNFGTAVDRVGDLDGDGVEDIVVGASGDDDGGSGRGAVYILFLNTNGTVKAEQKISDTVGGLAAILSNNDRFGYAAAGIGDLDGDGVEDIAVGSILDDDGGLDRGAVYVLFLNTNGTVKAEQKISDTVGGLAAILDDGDNFGHSVAGLGDVDGDGVEDIAVGVPFDDDGGTDRGAVYVLFLNTNGTVKAEQKISDTVGGLAAVLDDGDVFGAAMDHIRDLDGDGIPDLGVGASRDDDGGADQGAVYILFLNANGTVKAEQKISETVGDKAATLDPGDSFASVAGIGDLNGDGVNDIAVGATLDDDGGTDRGAVYILFLASGCCSLGLAETASTITVTGAGQFEMRFNTATGGGLDQFYDLAESSTRDAVHDLAGGASDQVVLFDDEIVTGATFHYPGRNPNGLLHLLEATPTRVKVRQDGRYHEASGTLGQLAGLQGLGDYSIYSIGRMATRWNRKTTGAVPLPYTALQLNYTAHYQVAPPLNDWTNFSESGALPQPVATDTFVLMKSDVPAARTDFLAILSAPWGGANGAEEVFESFGGAPFEFTEATWQRYTAGSLPAGAGPYSLQPGEVWNLLTYFKPTNLGNAASPWLDPTVTTRQDDYQSPSATTVGPGAGWVDANENTATDPANVFFNEAEAAYVFDLNPAAGLTLTMDGSTTTRYSPFLKLRRWQSFVESPVVTYDADGAGAGPAVTLRKNLDYKASLKPVARAHFAQDLLWHSTLESSGAVSAPFVGDATGTVETGMSYAAGRYGNGAVFDAATDEIKVVLQPGVGLANIELDRGRIEFWYKPNYAHTDNAEHYLFDIDADGVDGNSRIRIKKESNASCGGCPNALTAEVSDVSGAFRGVTILSTNYSWRAADWVHLALEWDSFDATDNVRAYLNGVQLVPVAVANGIFTMEAETAAGILRMGNKAVGPGFWNADGTIDEFRIYSAAPQAIAHGGLTSDPLGREKLANPSDNFPLALQPVDASGRGPYLFFGFDSKPKGLNVSLATPGAGVTDNQVQWYFWNGTAWQAVFPTDGTNSFKKTGTIWWDPDWPGWSPYSLGGGPDLYYMMARLQGVTSYTMTPVERVIKTDILLFQYCSNVTTANATFTFAVPPTTEVKLSSFAALPGDRSVTLEWRTGSELDNLGFHLYRALSEKGPWTRLTSALIPGLGSSAVGQAYAFRDAGLANGTRYFYRLDDVDASSKTTSHGPVSAVPSAAAPGGTGGGTGGASDKKKNAASATCPDWVLAAYGSSVASDAATASLGCTRHGDPEAVSLGVVSRDSRQATLELRTGGFYALHALSGAGEASGRVRVFVPGFDFPQDPQALALPLRRALVDAVVGRRVQLGGVRALDQVSFKGLVPASFGQAEMQVSRDGTVRARRRAARESAPQHVSLDLARLLPSVFQGETKSAVVQITPLRFDARRQRIVLAKRVLVKLLFTGRETGESGRGRFGRRERPQKPVTGELLARLYTKGRGLYAVSFEQLFSGRSQGLAASRLRLERQGQATGFHLEPAGDLFGPGGVLYFYADTTSSSTEFSSETAWELLRARDGIRMPLVSATPSGDAVTSGSTARASFEVNRFYQPGLLEAPELWLWEALASGATRSKSFSLGGVDAASSPAAELEVFLQGASESGNLVDHHVSVSVNGVLAGEAQFAGKKPYRMSLRLPAALLREAANELSLTNVADTGETSFVFLDRFAVSYPQSSSLASGVFEGTWAETGTATVTGEGGAVTLLDVTATASWLRGYESTGGSLRFRVEAGHRYLAVAPQVLGTPRVAPASVSTLRAVTNQSDYLLVAPRAFLAAAEPLLARRQDQGLAARAVAFEEIADEFGHGRASAEAIRGFLAYAFHSWARPSPRYVLLLGDSTYDPRNFIGTSQASPLPALWAKTSYLWTVSDPELAAVNGDDALPDLAIGRLPAATVEQAHVLVEKLIAWEDSGQGLSGQAALVADNPDPAGDFDANIDDIARSFLQGRAVSTLKLSQMGAQMRPAIQDALNSGLSLLSYVGHGGAAVWASENVWNSWDAPSLLAQSRLPFLLTMNCLNGYFVAPAFDSLSESLLKAEGRGAIAAFSPSGLSLDGPAHQYHRALMAELTNGQHQRLGDAVVAAQRAYTQTGIMPELLSVYHLLGDPAMRVQP